VACSRGWWRIWSAPLEFGIAFSSEMGTGSREENASN
jgi:hypothetical protein